ncbi:hypothetical protein ABG79_02417 [Caloramator mitchellensis]|uniref:Uncharacterized protein n=1 Tax=Caloramator mitchellensis TaxID=908809 RepID=A0A0R3JZ54_CALMK|nr:hypothetical protein ABG79_02417 [Caloramator mitchellensis]
MSRALSPMFANTRTPGIIPISVAKKKSLYFISKAPAP